MCSLSTYACSQWVDKNLKVCHCSSHEAQLKTLDIIYKTNIIRLKKVEWARQTGQGSRTQRMTQWCVPRVFFLPLRCQTWSWRVNNSESPMSTDKKHSNKSQLSLAKGWERGSLGRQNILDNNQFTLTKHHQKKLWPQPLLCQVSPRFPPLWGCDPCQSSISEDLRYQQRLNEEPEFLILPSYKEGLLLLSLPEQCQKDPAKIEGLNKIQSLTT